MPMVGPEVRYHHLHHRNLGFLIRHCNSMLSHETRELEIIMTGVGNFLYSISGFSGTQWSAMPYVTQHTKYDQGVSVISKMVSCEVNYNGLSLPDIWACRKELQHTYK